ncbi:uncharacterized protein LOC117180497 [Belonocnema kinseyi]|uniref:uncharacterized protein LOC117180497 n=1 Tax=Belonocnema kinseyi TaxID=2817044 RepID=UPI00143D346E|nr:uncharacterized protein LOC117180497 [Belonocnema kinseyi]
MNVSTVFPEDYTVNHSEIPVAQADVLDDQSEEGDARKHTTRAPKFIPQHRKRGRKIFWFTILHILYTKFRENAQNSDAEIHNIIINLTTSRLMDLLRCLVRSPGCLGETYSLNPTFPVQSSAQSTGVYSPRIGT